MLMNSLEFGLWIVARILCSCLLLLFFLFFFLFDAIVVLHAMDEKTFNDFLTEK